MSCFYYCICIKFCGMIWVGDVCLVGELGVDVVGFIFVCESSCWVVLVEVCVMCQVIVLMVDVVVLFCNNSKEEVCEVLCMVWLILLQFYGEEDESFCCSFNMFYLKVIVMGGCEEINVCILQLCYFSVVGFLFDSYVLGGGGGIGVVFDWGCILIGLYWLFLLVGGLNLENVYDVVLVILLWGVDVFSGIELELGIKDGYRMCIFVEEVCCVDCVVLE